MQISFQSPGPAGIPFLATFNNSKVSIYITMKLSGNILTYLMQFLILMTVLFSIVTGNFFVSIAGTIALFLTLIPYFFGRETHLIIPWEVTFLIALTLYLHIAGYSQGWYESLYPYYDKVAHLVSSITIAMIGFLLVLILHRFGNMRCSRTMIFFFIVIFTMALGSIWEILEYTIDQVFGNRLHFNTMLQHGLDDTMLDLIFDLIGGLIVAAFGTWYLKRADESEIVDGFIEKGKKVHLPILQKGQATLPDTARKKECIEHVPSGTADSDPDEWK